MSSFDDLMNAQEQCAFDAIFGRRESLDNPSPAATARKRHEPAQEGAAPTLGGTAAEVFCERCKDTKLVTLYDTYMGDADDQPCPDCREEWP